MSATMTSLPILQRALRTHWRDRRSFLLLLGLAGAVAIFLLWRYADESVSYSRTHDMTERLREVGQTLWWQIGFLQTALALLVAPAQTAGNIARERERGLLENLMLAPITPARIVLEKWVGGMAPLLLIWLVLLPFLLIINFLGGLGIQALGILLAFQILLLATGAAIGLACSAWSHRAHLALRSAYGLVILWILGSGVAAFLSGGTIIGGWPGGNTPPFYIDFIGRTNPFLGAYDLIVPGGLEDRWFGSVVSLLIILIFCLWAAMQGVRRPLVQAPFIGAKNANKSGKSSAKKLNTSSHFEVPLIGALHFSNPVLGREVRAKFRLRQPPLPVIIVEIVLALAVAYFYVWTIWTALTDTGSREIIFAGVTITGFIITLISCAVMGANGFSREFESGTWEGVRLSLLRPSVIVAGKLGGIALACALFSLPVWPLLLPCVEWSNVTQGYSGTISVWQLVAIGIIWLGCVVSMTMWGLWMGLRTRKSSSATGATMGTATAWLVGVPIFLFSSGSRTSEKWAEALNPIVAWSATGSWRNPDFATQLGLPFLCVALIFSALMWVAIARKVRREFGIVDF